MFAAVMRVPPCISLTNPATESPVRDPKSSFTSWPGRYVKDHMWACSERADPTAFSLTLPSAAIKSRTGYVWRWHVVCLGRIWKVSEARQTEREYLSGGVLE